MAQPVDLSAESKQTLRLKMKDVVLDIDKLCGLAIGEKEALASLQQAILGHVAAEKGMEKTEVGLGKADDILNQMMNSLDEVEEELHIIDEMRSTFNIIQATGGHP
ncbi:unnamed protein product, partial [Mesorhabditis spiculigera]